MIKSKMSKIKIKTQPTSNHGPSTVVGRDVVPNVPDLFRRGWRSNGTADVAQGQAQPAR